MKRITFLVLVIILISTVVAFSVDLNELVGGSMSLICTGQFYRNMIYWPQEAVTFQKEILPSYGLDIGTKMQWTDKGGIAHDVKVFEVMQNGFYPVSDNNQPICESFERRLHYPLPNQLLQNFPNPFNGVTTIHFTIPRSSFVTLEIYDITGRLVTSPIKNERLAAGTHRVRWNGKDLFGNTVSSGIYFCFFKAGFFRDMKHILFLK